jgi:cytidine deaminase
MLSNPQLVKNIRKKAAQSISNYRIAAFGFNRKGELVAKSTNRSRFCRYGGGLHAEMLVMAHARKKGIKTIFICRIDNSGNLLPIDPCKTCARKADQLGIKIISLKPGRKK